MSISVVIPTKNRLLTLSRALDSVTAQTLAPDEIIVVDDGSDDDTPQFLAERAAMDGRIIVLRNENSTGAQNARNSGAQKATGATIGFLDSDDYWHPDKLRLQSALLDAHPGAPAAFCNTRYLHRDRPARISHIAPIVSKTDLYGHNVLGGTSGVLVRRQAFAEVGGFAPDMPYVEDWDLWLRLADIAPLRVVPDVLVDYHFDGGGQLSSNRSGMEAGHRRLFASVNRLITDAAELRRVRAKQERKMAEFYARKCHDLPASLRALWKSARIDPSLPSLTASVQALAKSAAIVSLRRH